MPYKDKQKQSEYINTHNKSAYLKRKENGLCVRCGKPNDRAERSCLCNSCTNKANENQKKDYIFYVNLGICPWCRQEKIMGQERACKECRAKRTNLEERYKAKNKDIIYQQSNARRKAKRDECAENGICTICTHKQATPGYRTCDMCRTKKNNYCQQQRMQKKQSLENQHQLWKLSGKCYMCGGELYLNYKICEACYNKLHNKVWYNDNAVKYREEAKNMGICSFNKSNTTYSCTCCRDCVAPKRHVDCHSTCPEYVEWRANKDRENEERYKRNTEDAKMVDSIIASVKRVKSSRRSR